MTSPRKTAAEFFTNRIVKGAAVAVLSLAVAVPATGALTGASGEERSSSTSGAAAASFGSGAAAEATEGGTRLASTRPAWLEAASDSEGVGGSGRLADDGKDFSAEQMMRAVPAHLDADAAPKGRLLDAPVGAAEPAGQGPRLLGRPSAPSCEQSPIGVGPGGPGYCDQSRTPVPAPTAPTAPARVTPAAPVTTTPAATAPAASTARSWAYTRQLWGTDQTNVVTRTTGRIFWTNPSTGKTNFCSGTVVKAANQSVVWTAGHCVHGGKGADFHRSNWRFVPAYHNGQAPYGQFPARDLWSTTQWMQNGSDSGPFTEDFGAGIVGTNAAGRTLMQAVGTSQGIVFNQSTEQQFLQVGYPGEKPFNGSVMYACVNRTAVVETIDGRTASQIGAGCDMTGGSSGGPWLIGVQANGLGYVTSVTSSGSNTSPQMYGPYQGATAQALFTAVQAL